MTIKLQAPITLKLAVSIVNEDASQSGEATFALPPGRFHDEAAIREALADFEKNHMPAGFRLMNKREWFNSIFGQCHDEDDEEGNPQFINYAMPGGDNWEN